MRRPWLAVAIGASMSAPLSGGCFEQAPKIDDDAVTASGGGTSTSATGGTSASTGTSSAGTVADGSSASTGRDPDGSSSDEGMSEVATDPPVSCACPEESLWCETFEPPFMTDGGGWGVPGGGAAPAAVDAPTHCGEGALLASVETGDTFSAITGQLPAAFAELGQHRISAWVRVAQGCLAIQTRLVQVQFSGLEGNFRFGMEMHADADTVFLRMQGSTGGTMGFDVPYVLTPDAWTEVAFAYEVTAAQATMVSLSVGGTMLFDEIDGPASGALPYQGATINLGVFRDGVGFDAACTAVYDDASAS